jgi:hypothetical protein
MNYKTSALILAVAWTAIVAVEITLKIDAVCDLKGCCTGCKRQL